MQRWCIDIASHIDNQSNKCDASSTNKAQHHHSCVAELSVCKWKAWFLASFDWKLEAKHWKHWCLHLNL